MRFEPGSLVLTYTSWGEGLCHGAAFERQLGQGQWSKIDLHLGAKDLKAGKQTFLLVASLLLVAMPGAPNSDSLAGKQTFLNDDCLRKWIKLL